MKKQTQSSARLTQDHSGNTWQCQIFLYIPFPSFQLLFSVSLLFLSYLVLADPSENLDGLAVCHIEVGNEDSIVYTLGCSCPYFPLRQKGQKHSSTGLSELQCAPWRNTAAVGFATLISQADLHSRPKLTLTPLSMQCPTILSTFKVCPSYLLTKWLGAKGVIEGYRSGSEVSKTATEVRAQILEGL